VLRRRAVVASVLERRADVVAAADTVIEEVSGRPA